MPTLQEDDVHPPHIPPWIRHVLQLALSPLQPSRDHEDRPVMDAKISAALALAIALCQGIEARWGGPDREIALNLARLTRENASPALTAIVARMDNHELLQVAARIDPFIFRIAEGRNVPWLDCAGLAVALLNDATRTPDASIRLAIGETLSPLHGLHGWLADSTQAAARDPTLGEQWQEMMS